MQLNVMNWKVGCNFSFLGFWKRCKISIWFSLNRSGLNQGQELRTFAAHTYPNSDRSILRVYCWSWTVQVMLMILTCWLNHQNIFKIKKELSRDIINLVSKAFCFALIFQGKSPGNAIGDVLAVGTVQVLILFIKSYTNYWNSLLYI